MLRKINRAHKRTKGFTLVEVLIAVTIISILAAVGYPSLMNWLPGIYLKNTTFDLYGNMQRGKIEAVKRNSNVVVSFTTVDCASAIGGGYRIFVDNGATLLTWDATEHVVASETMTKDISICSKTSVDNDGTSFSGGVITGFTGRGFPLGSRFGHVKLINNQGRENIINLRISGGLYIE